MDSKFSLDPYQHFPRFSFSKVKRNLSYPDPRGRKSLHTVLNNPYVHVHFHHGKYTLGFLPFSSKENERNHHGNKHAQEQKNQKKKKVLHLPTFSGLDDESAFRLFISESVPFPENLHFPHQLEIQIELYYIK